MALFCPFRNITKFSYETFFIEIDFREISISLFKMRHPVLLENVLASEDLLISLHYSKLSMSTNYLNAPVETPPLPWELQSHDINTIL